MLSRVKSRVADFWAKNWTLLLGCPGQFPNIFFSKPSFHPGQIQKRTFYHNIPSRANPKRILLSQHFIQGSSKKNTFITTFLPSRVVPKAILYFYYNLPSRAEQFQKEFFYLTTFLPSRAVPKGILLSQHSFHPGKFQGNSMKSENGF